jgi:hypothetical protein
MVGGLAVEELALSPPLSPFTRDVSALAWTWRWSAQALCGWPLICSRK